MNWKSIPIPVRMQNLERDARGYPIPFNIWRDTTGRAHFTINDHEKAAQCLRENLCPICGQELGRTVWFCGGPLSAFDSRGTYIDQPMHDDCVHYASQVCPYLAAPKYLKRIDAGTVDPAVKPAGVMFKDPTVLPNRPEFFVLVEAFYYNVTVKQPRYTTPGKPYVRVEFWERGRQRSFTQACMLMPELAQVPEQFAFYGLSREAA